MAEQGPTSEQMVAVWAIAVLCVMLAWRALRWFLSGTATPNPWEPELDEQMDQPDAVPLCTRCLEPHHPAAHFCSDCGAPVSPLSNWYPYLYLFSLGDVLRVGSFGRFRTNWLTISGFVLMSFVEYVVFAPIYWFFLARNIERLNRPNQLEPPIIPASE